MPTDPIKLYQTTVSHAKKVLTTVGSDRMQDPTPCSEWDVKQLLDHIAGAQKALAGMIAGADIGDEGSTTDQIDRAASAIVKAASAPGGMEKLVQSRQGEAPTSRMVGIAIMDLALHTWDLAKATGQNTNLDSGVVDFMQPILKGMVKDGPSENFAAIIEVPDSASAQDKFIALSGREP